MARAAMTLFLVMLTSIASWATVIHPDDHLFAIFWIGNQQQRSKLVGTMGSGVLVLAEDFSIAGLPTHEAVAIISAAHGMDRNRICRRYRLSHQSDNGHQQQ